ncbi:FKBP-type peptidyl-prolyl cis-trans isomerase [Candidatus Saccharibacteria bacterium]|nr:FKBP-type peptidyl-prolyl cis-trans isomerase [Candidatus Saccharibacteria bacterium]
MAKTPMRHRIFAGLGAVLFLVTASALTIAVIVDMVRQGNTPTDTTDTTATTCQAGTNEETLPAPEVYKPSGEVTELQTTDLTEGTGAAAKNGDCLVMKYYGTLASDGTMFDENFTKPDAFAFTLGSGQVIKGWDQGLVGMKEGGERRLVIPPAYGYGDQAQGSIPANSTLVFDVKLLRIQK